MILLRLLLVTIIAAALALGSHVLSADENGALIQWLAGHPDYRAATEADCSCGDYLKMIRTSADAVPTYRPYAVAGAFNKDGAEDFAAIVVKRVDSAKGFGLLVFNGGGKGGGFSLAFSQMGMDLKGQGLFFGPPAGGMSLLLGPFYSDAGFVIEPKGRTYGLK